MQTISTFTNSGFRNYFELCYAECDKISSPLKIKQVTPFIIKLPTISINLFVDQIKFLAIYVTSLVVQFMYSRPAHRMSSSIISILDPFSFPELRSSWPAPRIESSGRFQSVLATDWSDGNTIKMLTGRNRKRMAEGILFSVCRTCNRYIISNNHPLYLFGEKTIRERIVRDWEEFSGLKISVDDGLLPSRICWSCYVTVTTFQEFIQTVVHSKAQHESVIRSKRRKSVQQSPSFPRCGTREKKEQGQLVMLRRIFD